jgi:hypothetical protein
MIRGRYVVDVRAFPARHVTNDAIVVGGGLPSRGRRQSASLRRVTMQAALPEVLYLLLRGWQSMWVMTGDARHLLLAVALQITLAFVHLFDVPDKLMPARFGRAYEDS